MIEVRPLRPDAWGGSEPVVAYNNADGTVVYADSLSGERRDYYDRYGYGGSREITCIDCKCLGLEVPVILVEPERSRTHFRHPAGLAPVGKGRHGETAQHIYGKHLIAEWARTQSAVITESVAEEHWTAGVRLRSDVRATLQSGMQVAFEVQRKQVDQENWERRHGRYREGNIKDVWLWAPTVGSPRLGRPMVSVVFDVDEESLGVFVARYHPQGYRHPWSQQYRARPTHYAAAPLAEWRMSDDGWLVAPPDLVEFIGSPPASSHARTRSAERTAATTNGPGPSSTPVVQWRIPQSTAPTAEDEKGSQHPGPDDAIVRHRQGAAFRMPGNQWRTGEEEEQRVKEALARIFGRKQ